MKKLFYIVLILLSAQSGFSQIIDTCFVNETSVYHVKNQQENSFLYWEVSGGEIISENPTKSDSIIVKFNTTGLQILSIFEQNAFDCIGEISEIEILVTENDFEIGIKIPEAFSPNGDSKNNTFVIKTNRLPESYDLSIFNRWGNKLFETDNIDNQWDGKYKNKDCSEGVFYYILEIKVGIKNETHKGFIYLKR